MKHDYDDGINTPRRQCVIPKDKSKKIGCYFLCNKLKLMYCELNSNFRHFRGLHSFMYCELIFVLVVLLIDIPLSLSLGYQSQMYSMHDPNRYHSWISNAFK